MDSGNRIHALSPRVGVMQIVVIDKDSGYIIYLSIEHGFWKWNTCTVSPRVGVM